MLYMHKHIRQHHKHVHFQINFKKVCQENAQQLAGAPNFRPFGVVYLLLTDDRNVIDPERNYSITVELKDKQIQ